MENQKIYTIKISEALKDKCGCPLCTLEERTERDEIERILGASMMEPDVRIKTNELGFCGAHYEKLMKESNRLSLALMLETHLTEFGSKLFANGLLQSAPDPKKQIPLLAKNQASCYLCSRVGGFMSEALAVFLHMYKTDEQMDGKIKEQPYICLKHQKQLFELGQKALPKDLYKKFCKTVNELGLAYTQELIGDINWFCKKFDYRYRNEDWKNSKDAIERAVKFLKD